MFVLIETIVSLFFWAVIFLFKYIVFPVGAVCMLLTPLMPLFAWLDYKNDPRVRR